MHPGFLPTGILCEINCNKISDNSDCHSVGNLAKRFDEVNLTVAEPKRCMNFLRLHKDWDSYRVTKLCG